MIGLSALCSKLGFDTIVSIDDSWTKKTNSVYLKEVVREVIDTDSDNTKFIESYLEDVDFFSGSFGFKIPIIQDILFTFDLEESDIMIFQKMFDEVAEVKNVQLDYNVLDMIQSISKEENIKLEKLTAYGDLTKEHLQNTIIFLDIYNEGKNELIEKLVHIKTRIADNGKIDAKTLNTKNIIICVLSHDEIIIKELIDSKARMQYLEKESRIDILSIDERIIFSTMLVPLNKNEFNKEGFISAILNGIFGSKYAISLLFRKECQDESISNAMLINNQTVKIISEESYIEGGNLISYINRKLDTSYNYVHKNKLLSPSYSLQYDSLLKLESILHELLFLERHEVFNSVTNNDTSKQQKDHNTFLNEYRKSKIINSCKNNSEYLIMDYTVNHYCIDPNFGDLFLYTDDKGINRFALLVSMPCNNIIRIPLKFSGPKAEFEFERYNGKFEVIILDDYEIDENSPVIDKFTSQIFPILANGKKYSLRNSTVIKTIDPFILDYCTFNEDGAYFNINIYPNIEDLINEATKKKTYSSTRFYSKQIKEVANMFEFEKKRLDKLFPPELLPDKSAQIKQNLFEMMITNKYELKYTSELFSICRIGRLNQDIAYSILQEYTANLLKVGLEAQLPGE